MYVSKDMTMLCDNFEVNFGRAVHSEAANSWPSDRLETKEGFGFEFPQLEIDVDNFLGIQFSEYFKL